MWKALEWMMRDPEVMSSKDAQKYFFDYYEAEDAALIKRLHCELFED
jgi:hypothetical protein